jgi:hypothetical protein
MTTPSPEHRILHSWTVTVNRAVPKTTPEVVNGQTVSVTRDVIEPVTTRFALRDLTRKERRAADVFLASRTAHYWKDHGLLLAAELTNRLTNTTGGVLTDREKGRIEQLREKHAQLDNDLARLAAIPAGSTSEETAAERKRLQTELTSVRTELINLNAVNESVYSQTADHKAQSDQSNWVLFHTVLIERAGKWHAYFEGETFDQMEAAMWAFEDARDALYLAALPLFSTYAYWYTRGVDTPDGFKLIEEELAKQAAAAKEAAEKAAAEAKAAAQPAVAAGGETAVDPVAVAAVSAPVAEPTTPVAA